MVVPVILAGAGAALLGGFLLGGGTKKKVSRSPGAITGETVSIQRPVTITRTFAPQTTNTTTINTTRQFTDARSLNIIADSPQAVLTSKKEVASTSTPRLDVGVTPSQRIEPNVNVPLSASQSAGGDQLTKFIILGAGAIAALAVFKGAGRKK